MLEALCVKVAYDSVQLAQQLAIGQTMPLKVRVGFSVGGGAPLFSALLNIELQPAGAVAVAGQPLGGPTDVDGFFATQLAAEQNAVVINVHACGVTLGNYLERICADTLVVRNSDAQVSRLRLGNATDGEIQAPCGHFSIDAEWTDGTSGAPDVTWAVSRGEFYIESPSQMRFRVPYGSGLVTVTATLVGDPSQRGAVTMLVDDLIGLWDDTRTGGRIRFATPNQSSETHPYIDGTVGSVLHSGTGFSGSRPSGIGSQTVLISGTLTGNDTMTGSTTFSGDTQAFSATRVCPAWP
ncbi:MAG: hypothetical protein ABIX12_05000 [Rubrivivax sp.]